MNQTITKLGVLGLLLVLVTPLVGAHAHATVVEGETTRCYIVTEGDAVLHAIEDLHADEAFPEFWIETNGVLEGGVATGAPSSSTGLPVWGAPFYDVIEEVIEILEIHPDDIDDAFEEGHSGLQRVAWTDIDGNEFEADTQVDFATWAALCL